MMHGAYNVKMLKYVFEDSEEKPEHKREDRSLFKMLMELKHATLTTIWRDVLEHFSKTSEKLQTLNLGTYEGYLRLSSLNLLIK
jgi:hypothetical protein